jgi:DNA-binding CsgD family transcriptional regulator
MELAEAARSTVDRFRPAEPTGDWTHTLRGVANLVQAEHAVIVVEDAGSSRPLIAESAGRRHQTSHSTLSVAAVASIRPLMRRIPAGTALRSDELDCGFYALAAREQLDGLSIFVAAYRPHHAGDFAAADAVRLEALLPVLCDTVSMHHSLGIFRQQTVGFSHVLENLDCAVILLDAGQRPVFMNGRARELAEAKDGLFIGDAGLTTARMGETRSLQHAVVSAIEAAPACALASVYVHRDENRSPLKLDIISVGGGTGPRNAARVIVLIREPDAPRAFDREALSKSYDLTPREAELAILLATGHTLSGAAAVLKIGLSTVRWYLKHLFEKTDTHRQAELIRLVVGGFGSRSA